MYNNIIVNSNNEFVGYYSQLSACLEAIQSILYPFVWQHTIISMIPAQLCRDLLEAPVPLLAGLLINGPFHKECPLVIAEIENINFEEVRCCYYYVFI